MENKKVYVCWDGKKFLVETREEVDANIKEMEENPDFEMPYTIVNIVGSRRHWYKGGKVFAIKTENNYELLFTLTMEQALETMHNSFAKVIHIEDITEQIKARL